MSEPTDTRTPRQSTAEDRRKLRLGSALRANLQRRKSQARARATEDTTDGQDSLAPVAKIGSPE